MTLNLALNDPQTDPKQPLTDRQDAKK